MPLAFGQLSFFFMRKARIGPLLGKYEAGAYLEAKKAKLMAIFLFHYYLIALSLSFLFLHFFVQNMSRLVRYAKRGEVS